VSQEQTLLLTSLFTFALVCATYYRAWAYPCAAAGVAYWTQCVWLGALVIWPDMPVIFCLVTAVGVALPLLCTVLFAIDVWFGAFTTDMTYFLILAWLLSPLPFAVNLIALIMGGASG